MKINWMRQFLATSSVAVFAIAALAQDGDGPDFEDILNGFDDPSRWPIFGRTA